MKPEFEEYVRSLGVSDVLFDRIERLLSEFANVYKEDIETIFISDYYDNEGKRQFESMWLFSENFIMEGKNIETTETIDITRLPEALYYMEIEKSNYDMNKAKLESRLSISVTLTGSLGLRLKLKAGGENCDVLRDIVQKYFLTRI